MDNQKNIYVEIQPHYQCFIINLKKFQFIFRSISMYKKIELHNFHYYPIHTLCFQNNTFSIFSGMMY